MKTLMLTAVTALFALGCAQKKANTHTSYQKTEQMTENQQMDNEVMDEEEPQSKTSGVPSTFLSKYAAYSLPKWAMLTATATKPLPTNRCVKEIQISPKL